MPAAANTDVSASDPSQPIPVTQGRARPRCRASLSGGALRDSMFSILTVEKRCATVDRSRAAITLQVTGTKVLIAGTSTTAGACADTRPARLRRGLDGQKHPPNLLPPDDVYMAPGFLDRRKRERVYLQGCADGRKRDNRSRGTKPRGNAGNPAKTRRESFACCGSKRPRKAKQGEAALRLAWF